MRQTDGELFGKSAVCVKSDRCAYFTFRKGKALSEIATRRLSAIREYTEFGSGFRIALRDLEIRGAGNVLGAEQHGHMDAVGYDLYMKLLNEAVLEEQGGSVSAAFECTVSYGRSAYIPDKYILPANQRLSAYRKIAQIASAEDKSDVLDELIDRYGEPPAPVTTLIDVSYLRALGVRAKISKIEKTDAGLCMTPTPFDAQRWIELARAHTKNVIVGITAKPYVIYKPNKSENELAGLSKILLEYLGGE